MKTFALPVLAAAALAIVPKPAHAVEPLDKFSVRVGGYVDSFDTKVRADGQTTAGTQIKLDRDLGLDNSSTIGYAGFTWRPWEHHEFAFTYYQNDADSTRMLARDITFQDTTYRASSIVHTKVAVDAYEASYTWWAASHETWALGPRAGLVWYRIDMSMDLQVDVDGTVVGGGRREEVSADLPSPTIGGSWHWVPAKDWRISADAGYIAVNFNDINADVKYGRIGAEWFPWEQAGFSLDYVVSKVSADATKNNFTGNVDFIDSGVRLGFVYRW